MLEFRRISRLFGVALVAAALLSACGGSRSAGPGMLPALPNGGQSITNADQRFAAAAITDVVAINAGGGASGSFAADQDFVASGTATYKVANPIDTSGVTNPAPQAVYQDEREGATISYTIPGLTAGAAYTVRLNFAELWWTSAGKRIVNVSINNSRVLTNFDIFATTGARFKAVAESFSVSASSTGTIAISLNAVQNYAAISAIEVASSGATPTPPPGLAINSGGAATGSFAADQDFVAAGTSTYKVANAIDTSGVSNPAPQAVYQDEREGATIAYTVPGLKAGAAYAVRLSFAELYWTTAGRRAFNVGINNTPVLTNFDIVATTGSRYKAVAESFNAVATSSGTIAITLTATTDKAAISAIEIAPGSGPTPTPSPSPTPSTAFVDWPTYGYDSQRTGFNPYTTGITPASISQLHLAWQTSINGGTQTQPIVATNVAGHQALIIVGAYFTAEAYDALSGRLVWQTALPKQDVQDCGNSGISGSAQYDKALNAIFMVAGSGSGSPNHPFLYRLDVGTGSITGKVDVTPTLLAGEANYAHSGVTLANGRIYLGTGSDCEGTPTGRPSWRGRVVSVDPGSMTLLSTFFTTWGHGGNFGGGGVWSWGGVSADQSGNIYVATGNAETDTATSPQTASAPFQRTTDEQAGYAEHLVKLSADLSTVEAADYPGFNFAIGWGDLDYSGTPVVYQPPVGSGCGVLSATQGKGGTLVINNTQNLAKLNTFNLSVPSAEALYIGNPGYSPKTGYLYAAITSSGPGSSLMPPGLAAIGGCGSSIAWHAQFGPDSTAYTQGPNPRSAPTVTAGGVVFMGTPCTSNGNGGCGTPGTVNGAVWAVDGTTGSVLGGGKPILVTGDNIRIAPSADGLWIWVIDGSGNLYGLTVDTSVKAVAAVAGRRVTQTLKIRGR